MRSVAHSLTTGVTVKEAGLTKSLPHLQVLVLETVDHCSLAERVWITLQSGQNSMDYTGMAYLAPENAVL